MPMTSVSQVVIDDKTLMNDLIRARLSIHCSDVDSVRISVGFLVERFGCKPEEVEAVLRDLGFKKAKEPTSLNDAVWNADEGVLRTLGVEHGRVYDPYE